MFEKAQSEISPAVNPMDNLKTVRQNIKLSIAKEIQMLWNDKLALVQQGKERIIMIIAVLTRIRDEGGINMPQYRQLYPTTENKPQIYGLPKVHKSNMPLRPIAPCLRMPQKALVTLLCGRL